MFQKTIILLSIIACFSPIAKPQNNDDPFNFFSSDSILNIKLAFNFAQFLNNYAPNSEETSASFYVEGDSCSQNVIIKKRGNFRKKAENCDFPSFSIQFNIDSNSHLLYRNMEKVKVVSHCQSNNPDFNQYILQEYLIYKIYNYLTDKSLKVRLVKFTYNDSANNAQVYQKWGILLEDIDDLAFRVNATVLDFKYLHPVSTQKYYFALMYLFQKMIINQDWSLGLRHNIDLIGISPDYKPIVVPFDFDMAGLTQVPYQSPSVPFKAGETPFRSYKKIPVQRKYLRQASQRILSQKENILNLYTSNNYLADTIKNKVVNSISNYFVEIEKKFN